MVRALVIVLMAVSVSRAEWYIGTNSDGRVVSVPVRTDPALDGVVGHITTNAAPYAPAYEPESQVLDAPIEVPALIVRDIVETNKAYGFYSIGGELVGGILDHASPRDPSAIAQRIESNRLERIQLRQDARTVRTNMLQNITDAQAITLSSTSTTAQVRSATIDLRRELIDTQQQVRDLAAIVRKMLKDNTP